MKKNVTGYINETITKLIRSCWFIAVILQSAININAQSAIPNKSFPIMRTRNYTFMDSISRYIKETDLELIYHISEKYLPSDFVKKEYIYNFSVLKLDKQSNRYIFSFDPKEDQIKLSPIGSYHIMISAFCIIGYEDGYIFDYNGLTFFSAVKLQDFMIRQYNTKAYKSFLNSGIGFFWFFIVDDGSINRAYALFDRCETPINVFDLKTGKIISYAEFDTSFYKIK